MKRRTLLAGVGSVGVLAGAGGILSGAVPVDSFTEPRSGNTPTETTGETDDGPIELETIEATGSEAGTLEVPNDGVTVAMFFAPSCGNCQALMPELRAARDELKEEYGDDLTVVSITPEQDHDELREWWDEHSGNWYLGFHSGRSLASSYQVVGYPVVIIIDENGEKHRHMTGNPDARKLKYAIEPELEAYRERAAETESEGDGENETDTDGETENESAARETETANESERESGESDETETN
ncbi:TlpA family protein disulfide reductase [Natrialba asiatica]|uniref:Alkyl hydroperoxide reductase/ thiol specific antioxidant/ Mal allergen n=1 Tax=Natrialba asiatica (strain ATCC 700177 / DSM 12278 / JCM 9576 / FERM P-10747 / NBRC 102637 / 172P1) TaxID=29540 RepID=M0AQD8_NATA1|nr:TlpA disulfide reductase family protein [Natrialba asiatica]ELZ00153.1 alkyl hydroperoxide reductase/ thiol specific antioxidant/ Mal allergen [Natrialba asiatica DSM 12278]